MSSVLSIEPVLEGALDARVERVEAVERERLGRAEAAARGGVRAVVAQDAVCERESSCLVHAGCPLVEDALAQHEVAEQAALLAEADLGAVGELARLAEVVDERGADEQVGVEAWMQRGRLDPERRDRDGVLEQAAEVGVVPA